MAPSPIEADLRLPEPFASIPRESFLFGPSPIQHLPRISAALSPDDDETKRVNVYAKREDCNSGFAYGGNKVRKLEYLAAEAKKQGYDTLVSIGGVQSNHTRAVAAVAAVLGLGCATVQERWVAAPAPAGGGAGGAADSDDPAYEKVGNIQLSRLMGSDARLDRPVAAAAAAKTEGGEGHGDTFGIEHKSTLRNLQAELESRGKKPYYIPAGASDHPLGGLGFARWALEVEAQERAEGIFYDTIIVCAVTGSTMAGMVAGFKLAQLKLGSKARRVVGIDASAKVPQTKAQVLRIAKATGVKIGLQESDISESDIILDERYHGGIYGVADERTLDAIRFGARTEAFITDPVYEGKSLAGMMDLIRNGEIPAGSNVLYAHLGGQPALNAYSSIQ